MVGTLCTKRKGRQGLKGQITRVNEGRVQDICDKLTQVKEGRVQVICELLTRVNKGRVQVKVVAPGQEGRVYTTTTKTSFQSWKVLTR